MRPLLAVRLDSAGDVLVCGPAVRALAAGTPSVDLLVSPRGREAAELLPGVRDVLVAEPPWSAGASPDAIASGTRELADRVRARSYAEAVVFTSYHQSALPMALVARLAGVPRVSATSDPDPGSLLDVRHRRMGRDVDDTGGADGGHEVEAALALAAAAGYPLPRRDDTRLRVLSPLPDVAGLVPERPYVVVHPGSAAASRGIGAGPGHAFAEALLAVGWDVVVTGTREEQELAVSATPGGARCLAGRTSLAQLACVLSAARALVAGNTGPAHLAAAVGTPVVSLFAPVVPVERWGPWGVPHVVLGDQQAPCAGSRARVCPVPGHPCLAGVSPDDVVQAVAELTGWDGTDVAAPTAVGTGAGRTP